MRGEGIHPGDDSFVIRCDECQEPVIVTLSDYLYGRGPWLCSEACEGRAADRQECAAIEAQIQAENEAELREYERTRYPDDIDGWEGPPGF